LGVWGSQATADFVAVLAMASRHFRRYDAEYADRCLAAARRSYEFLVAHPEYQRATNDGFSTSSYDAADDSDDRLWAAAELWEATGDAKFLEEVEARLRSAAGDAENGDGDRFRRRRSRSNRTAGFDVDWDWSDVKNLGLLTYLESQREGRDEALVEAARSSLIATADEIVATARAHGYARPLGRRYYWGCNGGVARQAVVLEAATRVADKPAYREVQLDALNHLLGRNVHARSYVTGLGHSPPMHPHDRRSEGDDVAAPWPGYLVGGPHPRATDWQDAMEDYRTNETAINWNSALIYALAAQLDE
jgi:endoglucanase